MPNGGALTHPHRATPSPTTPIQRGAEVDAARRLRADRGRRHRHRHPAGESSTASSSRSSPPRRSAPAPASASRPSTASCSQTGGYRVRRQRDRARARSSASTCREHQARSAASAQRDRRRGRGAARDLTGIGTILLVEDEDAVRLFGARALRNKGYKVLEARSRRSGARDLSASIGGRSTSSISDVVMPRMDGPTLIKEVRDAPRRPEGHLHLRLCRGRVPPAESTPASEVNFLPSPSP